MPLRILPLLLASVFLAFTSFAQKTTPGNYCDLLRSSTNDLVTTEAYMTYSKVTRVDGGDAFLFWPDCNNKDYFAATYFAKKFPKETARFLSALPNEKDFILKVTVTGRMRFSFIPLFGHLSWSRAQFEIDAISSISNVTSDPGIVRPDFEAQARLTESGTYLRDLNSELILNLLSGTISPENKDSFDQSFVLIDQNGREFALDQLGSIEHLNGNSRSGYNRRAVQQPKVEIIGKDYVATGLFWVENASGTKRPLEYRNIYRRDGDSFILMKISLRSLPKLPV